MNALAPALTPQGRLILAASDEALPLDANPAATLVAAFERGSGHALLHLGATETDTPLPAALAYWRDFGVRYVTAVRTHPDFDTAEIAPPAEAELARIAAGAPPMAGAEYLDASLLASLWRETDRTLRAELAASGESLEGYLKSRNPAWNLVGRVHFNLAENRGDDEAPFAFLATYTTHLGAQSQARHVPLGQALHEYAGARKREQLVSLLAPVQRAAEACEWVKRLVDEGDIYHPLRWTTADAVQLLRDTPRLEAAGVIVRVPSVWRGSRPPRPRVSATVGTKPPAGLGADALLDFKMEVTLDGERLTAQEVKKLLAGTEALAMIRGRWVEVDREKLGRMLETFERIEKESARGGIGFAEAMRLVAGTGETLEEAGDDTAREWSTVTAGPWLAQTLDALRGPEGLATARARTALKATLRPYQEVGLRWLHLLHRLRLGACLADDMGLGKTIQVLALLLTLRDEDRKAKRATRRGLLVAPASLLANWVAEIERFAPDLDVFVAHTSVHPAAELKELETADFAQRDLVITSYGSLSRFAWLRETGWRTVVLDEAQAIRNPGTQQSRAAKALKGDARIALTGTPIENKLGDLWSIFDFINPGLLGSRQAFTAYAKRLAAREHNAYGPLRELVRPYILRRLKTDRRVIADLPDKTEVQAFCGLSPKQAALYAQSVKALEKALLEAKEDGMQRKGLILSFLMRFKQICNHPSHWLGDGAWTPEESGKMLRLAEIAETIAAKQEKVLVFTQFREATGPVATFLASVFGRPGLVLHGSTAVGKRQDLVRRFQEDERVPFFVLSLKAGGSGLNLTAASHVVHFDRWWNPAVEDQATDRAYRIGQHRNVLVHKFVCRGTLEEKIDAMIASKRRLSEDVLAGDAETILTEMSNEQIMKLVALDIHAAAT
ncbi:MAG TPA: DEAD/DEAH box helicase [Burkholderiales bacterium]|nr:DEAD/DEAH box helicase [Burkholderiales bacterium]